MRVVAPVAATPAVPVVAVVAVVAALGLLRGTPPLEIAMASVSLAVAAVLFFTVFEAVRRRRLSESLTPIWLTCALAVSYIAIILTAPVIGAYADARAAKKRLLAITTAIGVGVKGGVVTLTGTVESWAKRDAAAQAAHRVTGALDEFGHGPAAWLSCWRSPARARGRSPSVFLATSPSWRAKFA